MAHLGHITAIYNFFVIPSKKKIWFCFSKQKLFLLFDSASEKISGFLLQRKIKYVFVFPEKIIWLVSASEKIGYLLLCSQAKENVYKLFSQAK